MFVGEARSLPLKGQLSFLQVGSGLTLKHYTQLERYANENTQAYLRPLCVPYKEVYLCYIDNV